MVDTEELELLVDILEWDSLLVFHGCCNWGRTVPYRVSHIPCPSALNWWVRSQTWLKYIFQDQWINEIGEEVIMYELVNDRVRDCLRVCINDKQGSRLTWELIIYLNLYRYTQQGVSQEWRKIWEENSRGEWWENYKRSRDIAPWWAKQTNQAMILQGERESVT